ncbi:MAG: helix-turn-helix domain-containing protein [Cyclobacteriaceae bacterium]
MQFDFIDIILSIGIVQGFFLAAAISLITQKNSSANKVLALVLTLCALVLVGKMVYAHFLSYVIFKLLSLTDNIVFLFGPLTYMYIRRLIVKSEEPFRLSYVHYIPALIHILLFSYLALLEKSVYIETLQSPAMNYVFNAVELLGLVSGFFYLIKSFRLIRHYRASEKFNLSYHQQFHGFLLVFMSGVLVCLIAWFFSYVNAYYLGNYFAIVSYHTVWITLPVFIYLIGFYSLKQPEIFRMPLVERSKSITKRLSADEVDRLKLNLESLLNKDQIHFKNDLTLSELSDKLDASSNDVSWLLNNEFKSTFYDFINQYRIMAFIARVEAGDHLRQTILSIAMEVGFNSKSTFNKAFKLYVNSTPSDYIKNLKIRSHAA